MELILMQHGAALSKEINPERPLSPVGRDQAARTGKLLRNMGLHFTAILSSPKARAVETAVIVAEAVGYPKQRIHADEVFLPKTQPKRTAEFLSQFPGDARVLAVGHLPNLADLASFTLTPGPPLQIMFENAGLTCLDLGAPTIRSGSLAYHLSPRLIQMMVGR